MDVTGYKFKRQPKYVQKYTGPTPEAEVLTRQRIRAELRAEMYDRVNFKNPELPHSMRRKIARDSGNMKYRLDRNLPEPRAIEYL